MKNTFVVQIDEALNMNKKSVTSGHSEIIKIYKKAKNDKLFGFSVSQHSESYIPNANSIYYF